MSWILEPNWFHFDTTSTVEQSGCAHRESWCSSLLIHVATVMKVATFVYLAHIENNNRCRCFDVLQFNFKLLLCTSADFGLMVGVKWLRTCRVFLLWTMNIQSSSNIAINTSEHSCVSIVTAPTNEMSQNQWTYSLSSHTKVYSKKRKKKRVQM